MREGAWPNLPLKELCDVRIGRTPRRDTPKYWGGENVWLTIRELNGEIIADSVEHITDVALQDVMGDPVPLGTLLLSFKLSIGKMAIAGCPLYTNEAIAALPLKHPEKLDRDFLAYAISVVIDTAETSHAVKGKLLNKKKLEQISIPVPTIAEQRHIVDILNRADSIRHLRKQAQVTASQLITALFIDMFGDPLTNPRDWPEKSLGNLVSLYGGGTPSKKNPEYWGGVIPWVSPKDMKPDCISDSIDHVTPNALEETTLKWIPAESVLIVVRGMILVHTVPIRVNSAKVTINQDMKALVPNEELSANYLRWTLQCMHSYVLSQVSTSAHGTRKLDTNRLLALSIPLPPLIMQEEFESRLDSIQSILHQQKAARNSAESSFQSLLHQAFNGAI